MTANEQTNLPTVSGDETMHEARYGLGAVPEALLGAGVER